MDNKISSYQLFAAMFILPYGSAVLFFRGSEAKQDAWFAILFYIIPGILLQLMYIATFKYYPKDSIATYLPKVYGRPIGILLSIMYILSFTYSSARNLRDFTSLITISAMPQTSRVFIGILLIITATYGVITGIETICRAAEILFPLMMLGLVLAFIFLIVTNNVLFFNRLLPVFEQGVVSDISRSWRLIGVPYGETVVFTMLYNTVNEPQKIKKAAILAIITEGVVLSFITIMFIAALGVNYASITNFPLLETLRLIKLGGFLDRLDIIIVVTLVVGGFMKISIFLYAATLGAGQLLHIKDIRYLALPFAIISLIGSELIAKNYPQHIKLGQNLTIGFIFPIIQIAIPVTTFLIAWFKNRNKKTV